MEPIFSHNRFVHCYKPIENVEDYIQQILSNEQVVNPLKKQNLAELIAFLLPLEPDRLRFSYQNGVLDLEQERFFSHHEADSSKISCRFFDCEFPEDLLKLSRSPFFANNQDPRDKPVSKSKSSSRADATSLDWYDGLQRHCSGFYKIFDDQLKGPQYEVEKRVNFAHLGRLLWPVNKLDNWQSHFAIVGRSQTGKTLAASVFDKIYGVLSRTRKFCRRTVC